MGDKGLCLAGSKTGYFHNVLVYYGRETQLIQNDLPHTVHDLFVDRYYASPLLALELDKLGITITGKILHYVK